MGANPAQVNRLTGDLFLNKIMWDQMSKEMRRFVLLHEEGHLKGGKDGTPTANEIAADLYAFRSYDKSEPGNLKSVVKSLDKILGLSDEHTKRKLMVYAAALLEDWLLNKNGKALAEYFNVKGELEKYHNVSGLPSIDSDLSGMAFLAALPAILSAITAGAGMHLSSKDKREAAEAAELYGWGLQAHTSNNIISQVDAMDAQKDKEAENMILLKYLGMIGVLVFIMFFAYKKYKK